MVEVFSDDDVVISAAAATLAADVPPVVKLKTRTWILTNKTRGSLTKLMPYLQTHIFLQEPRRVIPKVNDCLLNWRSQRAGLGWIIPWDDMILIYSTKLCDIQDNDWWLLVSDSGELKRIKQNHRKCNLYLNIVNYYHWHSPSLFVSTTSLVSLLSKSMFTFTIITVTVFSFCTSVTVTFP